MKTRSSESSKAVIMPGIGGSRDIPIMRIVSTMKMVMTTVMQKRNLPLPKENRLLSCSVDDL